MAKLRIFVTALAMAGMEFATARAADMPALLPMPEAPVVEDLSGWYLRGDVAYRLNSVRRVDSAPVVGNPVNNRIENQAAFGGGIGYKAGWVRADITFDYGPKTKYSARVPTADDVTAKVETLSGLFNVYFDLGTWSGLTPYIGAGIGGTQVKVSDYRSTALPPFPNRGNHGEFNLTWAAMAGFTYGFTPNLALDVGYRYLFMGDGSTVRDAQARRVLLKDITANEFRVGLRWMVGDLGFF